MGSAMAGRLLAAGHSVTIFARSPSKALPLLSLGAQLSPSPADLARSCDVVFTMLSRPQDVRQIILSQSDAVLPSLAPNSVLVDHTSSHPDLAKEISRLARANGCWAVDAPVSGGDVGAQTGRLSIFAGGDRGVVTWLSPLFEITGNKVTYMGDSGSGQSCKIGNQIVIGGSVLGLSEGLFFAEQAGLDREKWLEAVKGGAAGSTAMELFGKRIVGRDFKPGGFAEYMVKDLGMGIDFVEEEGGVVLPGAALCKQLYSAMVANGDGKLGSQALITVIERINGK